MPATKQQTASTAEQTVTDLKLRNTRIADSAGNIIKLEISSAPIILMPSTTVTAVRMASSML